MYDLCCVFTTILINNSFVHVWFVQLRVLNEGFVQDKVTPEHHLSVCLCRCVNTAAARTSAPVRANVSAASWVRFPPCLALHEVPAGPRGGGGKGG